VPLSTSSDEEIESNSAVLLWNRSGYKIRHDVGMKHGLPFGGARRKRQSGRHKEHVSNILNAYVLIRDRSRNEKALSCKREKTIICFASITPNRCAGSLFSMSFDEIN
jgi:hypothetical protein